MGSMDSRLERKIFGIPDSMVGSGLPVQDSRVIKHIFRGTPSALEEAAREELFKRTGKTYRKVKK